MRFCCEMTGTSLRFKKTYMYRHDSEKMSENNIIATKSMSPQHF